MANLTPDLQSKSNGASHDFKNKMNGVENSLESLAHSAGGKIGDMASNISDSASKYMKTSRDYVVENPAKSVAMAAAAGLVIGRLLSMFSGRKD